MLSYRFITFLLQWHIFIWLADFYNNAGPWIEGLNTRLIEAKAKVLKIIQRIQKKVKSNLPVGTKSRSFNKGLKFKPKWAKLSWSRDQRCTAAAASAHAPIHTVQHCSSLCSNTAPTQWYLVTTNAAKVNSKQQKWSVCNVGSFTMMSKIFAKRFRNSAHSLCWKKMKWKIPTFVVSLWKAYGLTESYRSCYRPVVSQ